MPQLQPSLDPHGILLSCRPNLIPTWDIRQAALRTIAVSLEPLSAEQVTAALSSPFGRPNEDDGFAVRAACSWLTQKKYLHPLKQLNHRPPLYVITDRGLDAAVGPITPFL